jgi:hypothetical protein
MACREQVLLILLEKALICTLLSTPAGRQNASAVILVM